VIGAATENPELAQPIVEGQPDLLAEVAIAARQEQARCVADVLLRRTRLGLLAAPQLRTEESVMPISEVLGRELGWASAGSPLRRMPGSRRRGEREWIRPVSAPRSDSLRGV
jgi:glycerol-3-phosphate dehydrogenase